jgi:hypothetical protein
MQMYTGKHWNECREPNGEVRPRTVGIEGVCNLIGRIIISTNQIPQSFQGKKTPTKEYTVGTHGSSWLCSRRVPYLASLGWELLGPVDVDDPV